MWSLEEDLRQFSEAGATCIELCEYKLKRDQLDAQLAAVRTSGLRVSAFQPIVPSFFGGKLTPSRGSVEGNRQALGESLRLMATHGLGDRLNTVTGVVPGRTWEETLPLAAEEYRQLCERARDVGIKILIEPLHPMYCGLDSMISTLREAARLIDKVGAPNLGITLDVWHVWQLPTVYDDIRAYADRIWAVHICDWRPPRSIADRHVPGEGQIPLGKLLRALEAVNYNNGYVVEIFCDWLLPDSVWRQDMRQVLQRCKNGFDKTWTVT